MGRLSMKNIKDILKLRFVTNISYRQIGRALGIPRSTVSDYCKRFEINQYNIDDFLQFDEDRCYKLLFPEKSLCVEIKRPLPDMEYIAKEICKKGVTFTLLWQEYKEQHPDGYGLSQFKEHYYKYKKKLNPTMRQTYIAGEKMFVDYSGLTFPITNQITQEISDTQIFVSVLGVSGYTFVEATLSQKQEDFIKSHSKAFNFYGGVPKIVVPDNLKSAVIRNNKKGIVINESYAELARHYNCAIEPARPYKPQDKAKAEQGVQAIQRWILAKLRNRIFFSVDELNQAIAPLLDLYNNKVMKKIGKSRWELFNEREKAYLQPLPANQYVYREFKVATVNLNYHIELAKVHYSVPFKYLKEKVSVRYSTTFIEIYHKSNLIATHKRSYNIGEYITNKEHMPKQHQYQDEKINPGRLLNWAKSIGVNALSFTQNRLSTAKHPTNVYSNIIAILNLSKVYGKVELDLALGYAISINAKSVKSIESILTKKLYLQMPANNVDATALNNHENIRGKDYYK
jgi:transposase